MGKDDKTKKDYRDRSKIDMNDPNEVNHVLRTFGCTIEELKNAIEQTGSNSRKVIYKFLKIPKPRP